MWKVGGSGPQGVGLPLASKLDFLLVAHGGVVLTSERMLHYYYHCRRHRLKVLARKLLGS